MAKKKKNTTSVAASVLDDEAMEALTSQLMDAAATFADDAQGLQHVLESMVADVDRAWHESLEIVPVAHHSPACAAHMVRRLQARAPKVIFMEMCEDLYACLDQLRDCSLPIALQAFASETDAFPSDWAPLTVVAPITEFSAEYQAIAFAMGREDVELVFVDRSVDHVFQQIPQEEGALAERVAQDADLDDEDSDTLTHGSALGIKLGNVIPSFDAFQRFLLRNANVRHYTEWWDQYVEQTIIHADYDQYRQVMFLVGSLLRRMGITQEDREADEWRERYMWTRMREYMKAHEIAPDEAIYICGAIHSVSDIDQFGVEPKDANWTIPEKTPTNWLYGIIPSSFSAIERQFSFPAGTTSLAEATWKKHVQSLELKPFSVKARVAKTDKAPKVAGDATEGQIVDFLTAPPRMVAADQEQLLNWCVSIVDAARKNGYLATTADSIAIYQTSMLLAGMRNRQHPSPYDFRDAAVTCLEKTRVPKKRDIAALCDMMLGGDRIGSVGYSSMPQLARDVYDRLDVLPVNLKSKKVERALMDFKKNPEYLPASDLLWKLHYLLSHTDSITPIMGERVLGGKPQQESWEIRIGKNQTPVIQLGYEGVTVEQVLQLRLKKMAFGPKATTVTALQAAEDSILYLKSKRLTEELGQRAVALLHEELSANSAEEIFERVRRLVHHYRSQPDGLASWIEDFVSTGYAHYATLLPEAFEDTDTSPEEISGMLGFIFTLESLALSLGCDRSQLIIAIRQTEGLEVTPDKVGLLWSSQFLLGERSDEEIRAFFDEAMENPFLVPVLPDYIGGFVLALKFTPLVGRLVVELLSKAFSRLPDRVLMPWMPGLIMTLKPLGGDLMPMLLKEASICYPRELEELSGWKAPWERAKKPKKSRKAKTSKDTASAAPAGPSLSPEEAAARALLGANPATTDALAGAMGFEGGWSDAFASAAPASSDAAGAEIDEGGDEDVTPEEAAAQALVRAHGATMDALMEAL